MVGERGLRQREVGCQRPSQLCCSWPRKFTSICTTWLHPQTKGPGSEHSRLARGSGHTPQGSSINNSKPRPRHRRFESEYILQILPGRTSGLEKLKIHSLRLWLPRATNKPTSTLVGVPEKGEWERKRFTVTQPGERMLLTMFAGNFSGSNFITRCLQGQGEGRGEALGSGVSYGAQTTGSKHSDLYTALQKHPSYWNT